VLIAAKLIGEIAGIDRFSSDAQLARLSGCAPIPVSSGRTDRYRLDHMLAMTKWMTDPQTATYLARQRQNGKTNKEAVLSQTPPRPPRLPRPQRPRQRPNHCLLDIGAIGETRAPQLDLFILGG
jgi:hypothetical protein